MNWSIIGLNEYEGRVLKALMTLGESGIGEIFKECGVPKNKIYEALEILMRKGLVSKTNISPLKYSAEDAEKRIIELLKEHAKEEKKFLKELKSIEKKPKKEAKVRIYEGKQNWYRALRYLDNGNVLINPRRIFSYSIKSAFEYHPQYVKARRKNKERNADYRNIGPITKETIKNVEKFRKLGTKIKHFNNENVAVYICRRGVIIGLINEDLTIAITDPDFIRMMKNLFEAAWKGLPSSK